MELSQPTLTLAFVLLRRKGLFGPVIPLHSFYFSALLSPREKLFVWMLEIPATLPLVTAYVALPHRGKIFSL
jgi:hypothetical protein